VIKHKSLKRKIAFGLLLFSLSTILILSVGFVFLWNSEKINTEALSDLSNPLVILDTDGNIIDGSKTQKYVKLSEISQDCIDAFISVEDKHFYEHKGLSYPRIAKALLNNIRAGYSKEGASTISQQLVKNTHLTHEKTLKRKIREAVLTKKLERQYSKDEILEMYLNAIYFGNNIYGIANASEYYFNKTPKELTVSESAGLSGMIQNPKKLDPVSHYDKWLNRGKMVVNLMYKQGYLTESEYQAAAKENPKVVENKKANIGSPYQNAVISETAKILNISESDVISYGCQIETYYDPKMQKLVYDLINEPEYEIKTVSGSAADKFVALTNSNGSVTALWGNTPTLANARRNFGSVVKPLMVYAPAIELGVISPDTMIDDCPLLDGDFNPQNVDGKYHGLVSVRQSIEHSYNIPAVKVMNAVGIENCCDIAGWLGLSTENENLSAALGNTKNGTTFFELLSGYQTLANSGRMTAPKFVKAVRNRNGKIIYFDNTNKYNYRQQGINGDTAYLVTDMLRGVSSVGTGKKLKSLDFQIASKTGTTERANAKTNTDATFIAYTTDNVLLLWAGNADMKAENDLAKGTVGGGMLGFITRDIYKRITADGKTPADFLRPKSVVERTIDTDDLKKGDIKLANHNTPKEQKKTALFSARFMPEAVSSNYLSADAPTVDGQISDNAAEIWFETAPHQVYGIYKNDTLQEVIANKKGKYHFIDKYPRELNTYKVTAQFNDVTADSNEIRLYQPHADKTKSTKPTKQKKTVPWFF
jgi:membrane peptidoglycan carboxypeptidase